ncbi:MAG: hypothetical protein WBQ23_16095 [Bacteroidota bacterium]
MKLKILLPLVLVAICFPDLVLRAQLPPLLWSSGPSQTRGITGTYDTWPNWNPIEDASPLGNGSYRVGCWDDGNDSHDDVLCFQWDLPGTLDSGAIVDSAHLIIRYSTDSMYVLSLRLYAPNYAIWSTDRSTIFYNAIFDQISEMAQPNCMPDPLYGVMCGVINTLNGTTGYYELWTTRYQNPMPLTEAVQDAIDNHNSLFSLVMRAELSHMPGRLWYINPADVTLVLYYHPPDPVQINGVTITNYVNGSLDYRTEPESLVRGDLNQFSGYDADYSQMPNFEPPHATRTWWTQRRHLAETWFTRFEDQSLPGPMKFRNWDEEVDRYKVIYQTPLYDGIQKDYRAIPDTVFPARLRVKREIAYEYDNLPFEFKDPWAVQQDTTGDSSQAILDYYREQTTPYEAWSDTKSLGVFLNQPANNNLHYGAHYWRYYHYNANDDSYDKKDDAGLEEGDLINMDEILYGKGTEVSPAGSIEQTRVTPGDEPFREYRLEYKDANNTMDFTGIYKAHLLSDKEAQPTRSANQRKIDIDPRGVYHLVYESAGEVWYTQSEDGATWSPEELVSSYAHAANNASLAVLDSSIYITFVESNKVMLKRRYKNVWYDYQLQDNYGDNNGAATTPVVSAGQMCVDPYGNPKGDIVVVVWDHDQYIEYNLLWLYFTDIYNQKFGPLASNTVDHPLFPTIDTDNEYIKFTVAWREGATIKAAKIGIPSCNPASFYLTSIPLPDVSFNYEIAVHAPSVTHNAETKPVVAYEVRVPSLIYSDRWVNVRSYDETAGTWNTTLYQIPYYQFTQYADPIAPSIGAHATTNMCGQLPEPGLRLAFHRNWGGGIRIGVIDCQYTEYDQLASGESFPSVVPFAPFGLLREAYSAPFQTGPFMHAIRTTNDYLSKHATPDMQLIRDLRVRVGNDVALLGVTGLSIRRGNNILDDVAWHPLPDSLVLGVDGEAHQILYTEPFTLSNGNSIDYRSVVYCSDALAMPVGVSLSLQMRKVSDGSLIQSFSLPLQNLQSDTVMWTSWSRPLTQVPAYPVYLSLGIEGTLPAGAEVTNAKVWLEDQYIPKMSLGEMAVARLPDDCVLDRNHPNPFNPGTMIPFALGHDGHVRLSVHDALGREVAVLVDEIRAAGRYEEYLDASGFQTGTYVYRLVFNGRILSRSMMLVK